MRIGRLRRAGPRLTLLGGFKLHLGEDAVPVPQSAQRVLALLALHERPVRRGQVASALWPDTPERLAADSLRSALWRIRRLGHGLVRSSPSHLVLGPEVGVDVRGLQSASRRLAGAHPPHPGFDLDDIVREASSWGGLLPDWHEDWVLLERERIRQVRLRTLEALCERLIAAGRRAEAVQAGLAAVAGEPLRESAQRALIRAHLSEGNVAEAIRQYRGYRHLLRDELGVTPSAQMEELVPPLLQRLASA